MPRGKGYKGKEFMKPLRLNKLLVISRNGHRRWNIAHVNLWVSIVVNTACLLVTNGCR